MSQNEPTIAIITVCRNADKFIRDTLESVANQTSQPDELIVIDGNSTDNTVSIIKEFNDSISFWVSDADEGISDAMNKGLKHSESDYILFLHADDYLASPHVLEQVRENLTDDRDIYGFGIFFQSSGHQTQRHSREFGFLTNLKSGIQHQGVFCHRRVFDSLGGFDKDLKIAMDYDFFLRAMRGGYKLTSLKSPIVAVMRDTGISSHRDPESLRRRFGEEKVVHLKNSVTFFHRLIYFVWWLIYPTYRRLRNL